MRKSAVSILLAAVILLFPYAVAFPVMEEVQAKPKTEFTSAELLEDYDLLWDELKTNYPFLIVLEHRGINIESLRQSNREILEKRIYDLNGFAVLLRDTFYRMDNLAHLYLVSVNTYDFYLALVTLYPDRPHNEVVSGVQTKTTYELLRANNASIESTFPEVDMCYLPEVNAVYFHFKSFDFSLIDRDKDTIADYLSSVGDVDHIIIDITGNPGGAVAYWEYNVVSPFGGNYVWEDNYVFLKKTPVNEFFFFDTGYYNIKSLSDISPDYEIPPFVQELGFTHFFEWHDTFPTEDYAGKLLKTQAKRWVLIDNSVYSSADSFAAFCKHSGWATLVGKTTLGDGADRTESIVIALKNTGLLVRFSSTTSANTDGTMNAEVGTAPDIPCERFETPLDTCLRLIADLK